MIDDVGLQFGKAGFEVGKVDVIQNTAQFILLILVMGNKIHFASLHFFVNVAISVSGEGTNRRVIQIAVGDHVANRRFNFEFVLGGLEDIVSLTNNIGFHLGSSD